MSTYEIIKQAILNKLCVTFDYDGHKRKMSPHVIGTKNSRSQALFYQYGGGSNRGLSYDQTKNWRCIFIDEIKNLSINNDRFQSAYNHSRPQSCVDEVDVEIGF